LLLLLSFFLVLVLILVFVFLLIVVVVVVFIIIIIIVIIIIIIIVYQWIFTQSRLMTKDGRQPGANETTRLREIKIDSKPAAVSPLVADNIDVSS